MKKLGIYVATAVLSLGLMTSSASASSFDKDSKPIDGGSAVFTGLSNSEVTPFATENVGGGTWNHGVTAHVNKGKKVYSDYLHHSKYHSSAAIIGNSTDSTGEIQPGKWAKSKAYGWVWQTGYTYWNTY